MTSLHLKTLFLFTILVISYSARSQYRIEVLDTNTFVLGEGVILGKTSFRGLSVMDDQTIWISGSRGTVARSVDGGKTFAYSQLKGYEKSDFRDIEAFDDKRAIIMSSGTPAYILKTIDGGQTWKEVYKNTDTAYFLDAMDFWDDKRGVLVGDPINGHFVLLQTNDGGETWMELDTTKTPKAMEGESVFAASGTSLRCWGKNDFGFISGGSTSLLYKKNVKKTEWIIMPTGLAKRGLGGFSFCIINGGYSVVGGDYTKDNDSLISNFTYLSTDTTEWIDYSIQDRLFGYKSCVELIEIRPKAMTKNVLITTGTSGTQVGFYGWQGHSNGFWFKKNISEPFHVVRKAKKGKAVFLAGPKGKIGKLVY